jgi:hypothetical protein
MNDSSNWSPGPLFAVGRGFDDVASLLDWVHQAEADHSDLAPAQFDDAGLVAELQVAAGQRAAAEARWLGLLAEAEKRHATTTVTDLPTSSWLAASGTHSARSARAEVAFSVELDHWPAVAEALADGRVSPEQARVIVHGLQRLPADLDAGQAVAVADQLVGFADRFGPAGLARLVNRAVEVVAPETADDFDRRAVERADAAQQRDRYAHLSRDLDGSWLLRAKLPTIPGTLLAGILRSMSARHRVAAAVAGETLTAGQATADALAALADHASSCGTPPRHGTDRPRILVAVDLDVLRGQLGTATLLNTAEPITARHARRLACDAGIIPLIMGGDTIPLDAGRERRLYGNVLRAALIRRDQGCAFPGCDRPPAECEAHHRKPWWAGGNTSLTNGVLLCPHHHHLVEPDPNRPDHQNWSVELDSRGHPTFAAPTRNPDTPRHWRQHDRYRTP